LKKTVKFIDNSQKNFFAGADMAAQMIKGVVEQRNL
jgi:hypothetical protein